MSAQHRGAREASPGSSPLDAAPARSRAPLLIGSAGATLLHAVLLAAAVTASSAPRPVVRAPAPQVAELIQIEAAPEEPPPPPAPPEPPPPAAPPPKAPPPTPKAPPRVPKVRAPEEAAPAAAQAAKVMEQAPKPEVLDFGETIVQGNSTSYAGGVTEAGGTSRVAVRDQNARAHGVIGGTGQGAIDRSREPSLAEGTRWDCPFPEEADDEGIDEAVVTLRVAIAANGAVDKVDVAEDPGSGFGREARRCALRKRWQAGLDRGGHPIAATRVLRVRFER